MKHLIIKEGTVLKESMFLGCNCETLQLPSYLTRIENWTFAGCSRLHNVILPENLEYIGAHAFEGCTSLKNIILPASLKQIDACAFAESGLVVIHIPDTCRIIGDKAFYKCRNIRRVTLGENLCYIGDFAFAKCSHLKKITITGDKLEVISAGAFSDCDVLKEVELPDSLQELGEFAFKGIHHMEVSAPASLEPHIHNFYYEPSLNPGVTSLVCIPDILTFENCIFNKKTKITFR